MNEYDYIVNAFTMENENTNLEVNNLNVGCITSKNNNFELDKEGNLTVKSIAVSEGIALNNELLSSVYPVGSIYMNVNPTNPAALFGGTWEQLKDRFLLGVGDNYKANSTGGEAQHTLTNEEIPWHYHYVGLNTNEAGIHSHGVWATFIGSSHGHYYDPGDALSNGSNGGTKYANPHSIHIAGNHSHTVSGNTAGIGGNGPHNNMPPYLTVYMWKRTS